MAPGSLIEDEIARQYELLWSRRYPRIGLTCLGYALTAIYLSPWLALGLCLLNLTTDYYGMILMRGLVPSRHRLRYAASLACVFLSEVFFILPPAIIWQLDANYAKPFAIGLVLSTLMHLATACAVHLRTGLAGMTGAALTTIIGNSCFWISQADWAGLAFANVSAAGGLAYAYVAMLSNHRLHKASAKDRAAAMAGDQAKSRFLAQMSHELRTPLNAILGMAHAELRRNKDALSQKRLSVLLASAEGLNTILDDILDMSAIQVGRLPIRSRPAIPQDEILATLGLFQPGIDEAELLLKVKMNPELGQVVLFDTQRLRQCLSNLLSNALKHTKAGEIRITAEILNRDTEDAFLQIEVADTGAGVPDALHESIFEPFFLNHSTANMDGGYTTDSNGLGLSICRAMARQMGGDLILLPNDPDKTGPKGARFVLTLALGLAPDGITVSTNFKGVNHTKAETPADLTTAASVTAGLKVLVVDDIATNRLVASTYLRMIGATIIEAESGDAALAAFALDPPDLVLLDMNMPGLSGLETLLRIRGLPAPVGQIPVIAMTADPKSQHQKLYVENMLDGYLAKPINPTRIESEIRSVLERATKQSRSRT